MTKRTQNYYFPENSNTPLVLDYEYNVNRDRYSKLTVTYDGRQLISALTNARIRAGFTFQLQITQKVSATVQVAPSADQSGTMQIHVEKRKKKKAEDTDTLPDRLEGAYDLDGIEVLVEVDFSLELGLYTGLEVYMEGERILRETVHHRIIRGVQVDDLYIRPFLVDGGIIEVKHRDRQLDVLWLSQPERLTSEKSYVPVDNPYAEATSKILPIMAILYIIGGIFVLLTQGITVSDTYYFMGVRYNREIPVATLFLLLFGITPHTIILGIILLIVNKDAYTTRRIGRLDFIMPAVATLILAVEPFVFLWVVSYFGGAGFFNLGPGVFLYFIVLAFRIFVINLLVNEAITSRKSYRLNQLLY